MSAATHLAAGAQGDRALQDVLELAHVAGKGVGLERGQRVLPSIGGVIFMRRPSRRSIASASSGTSSGRSRSDGTRNSMTLTR